MRRHNYEQFMKNSVIGLLADCVDFCSQHSEITDDEDFAINCFLNDLYKFTPYKNIHIQDLGNEVDIPEFMKIDNVVKLERRKNDV